MLYVIRLVFFWLDKLGNLTEPLIVVSGAFIPTVDPEIEILLPDIFVSRYMKLPSASL